MPPPWLPGDMARRGTPAADDPGQHGDGFCAQLSHAENTITRGSHAEHRFGKYLTNSLFCSVIATTTTTTIITTTTAIATITTHACIRVCTHTQIKPFLSLHP